MRKSMKIAEPSDVGMSQSKSGSTGLRQRKFIQQYQAKESPLKLGSCRRWGQVRVFYDSSRKYRISIMSFRGGVDEKPQELSVEPGAVDEL